MKKLEINEEFTLTNKLIKIHQDKLKELEEKESTIQERYKKMMDDELADIIREKTQRSATIATLESILPFKKQSEVKVDALSEAPIVPEDAAQKPSENEEKKEEEPVIQDTLFPENNEPEAEPEQQEQIVENQDQKHEEFPADTVAGDGNMPLEAPVFTNDSSEFQFGEDAPADESDDNPDDDDWASMPEDWK